MPCQSHPSCFNQASNGLAGTNVGIQRKIIDPEAVKLFTNLTLT
jgi:hypothetical protein